MANRKLKNPGSIPGPFYVDVTCIDCDLCRESAPTTFRREDEIGLSIAFCQPVTAEEWSRARDALRNCPTDSIGEDGLES